MFDPYRDGRPPRFDMVAGWLGDRIEIVISVAVFWVFALCLLVIGAATATLLERLL